MCRGDGQSGTAGRTSGWKLPEGLLSSTFICECAFPDIGPGDLIKEWAAAWAAEMATVAFCPSQKKKLPDAFFSSPSV